MMTVKELKEIAKKKGLKGYSRLRKDELILLLEKVGLGLENQKVDLLDEENPDIDVPILKPDVVTTKPKDVEKEGS